MSTSATVPTVEVRVASPPPTLYGPAFWLAYLANTALMIAVGVMFRYADFVTYLGGTEYELGWIVGIGMLGAISMRVLLGVAIDRYGAGRIWIGSLLLVAVSLLGHVWITQLNAPWVYLARILYTTGLAGAFGASITFISQRAPAHRTGEAIGALGSSGFIGMAIGPVVVDAVFAYSTNGRSTVDRMFVTAASITLVAMGLAAMASHYGADGCTGDGDRYWHPFFLRPNLRPGPGHRPHSHVLSRLRGSRLPGQNSLSSTSRFMGTAADRIVGHELPECRVAVLPVGPR